MKKLLLIVATLTIGLNSLVSVSAVKAECGTFVTGAFNICLRDPSDFSTTIPGGQLCYSAGTKCCNAPEKGTPSCADFPPSGGTVPEPEPGKIYNPGIIPSVGIFTNSTGSIAAIQTYIRVGINLVFAIAAILFVIFILRGGLSYISAGGDKEGTQQAQRRITSALIGLAITFSVYALIYMVSNIFGIRLFDFQFPGIGI